MSHPHIAQEVRDLLDDHNLVDHEPAGDDPAEYRTASALPMLAHRTEAAHTHQPITESR